MQSHVKKNPRARNQFYTAINRGDLDTIKKLIEEKKN